MSVYTLATTLAAARLPPDAAGLTTFSNSNGGVPWEQAHTLAQRLVAQMAPDEQNIMTFGTSAENGCSGVSGSVPRLNFSGFCLQDAGNGVRAADLTTGFASGISVAASWNRELAYERALYMGAEFKRKGVHVLNGPVVGPMGRIALDGRSWEGFGPDPYLSGVLANASVAGFQQSVIASVKHFIGNEQETARTTVSAVFDDQTLHELYLWPFQDAVHAGAGSVMCSYNRLNSTYACSDSHSLTQVLKTELAFPGFVLSDWNAQQDSWPSANAGLDMAMPSSSYWDNSGLVNATSNGSVISGRLADMATRILASWYHVFNGTAGNVPLGIGIPADNTAPHELIEARDPASKNSTLQSAIEGHVLLKNINAALPLNKPRMLSIFGYDATVAPINNPASNPYSAYNLGAQSINISGEQLPLQLPEAATLGTWLGGGGSGAITSSYWSDPYSAIQEQAYEDNTFLRWDFRSSNPNVSAASDVCLVFINEIASEAYDRPDLADAASDILVQNVAMKCANTIVVIHNVGVRTVGWLDHPNVTALVFAHLPGQDSGRALVELLYGKQSFSGRLPYTIAKNASDYGLLLNPCEPKLGDDNPQCYFQEGPNIDYKYFAERNVTPQFPFGYGLTYTAFGYKNLTVEWTVSDLPAEPPNPDIMAPGGITSLFDTVAHASFTLTNLGYKPAAEVPQLYITFPGGGNIKNLRGFAKELLQSGDSSCVEFDLTRRDLSRWNAAKKMWELQTGSYSVVVGRNALDPEELTATLVR